MRAVISAHSGIEGLEIRDIPMEEKLGPHDVRIKVHAVALNWRDYFKMTRIPWCRENPIPGSDASGEVVAVGEEVTRFKVGERKIKSMRMKFMTFWISFLSITSISCSFAPTGRTASAMRYN